MCIASFTLHTALTLHLRVASHDHSKSPIPTFLRIAPQLYYSMTYEGLAESGTFIQVRSMIKDTVPLNLGCVKLSWPVIDTVVPQLVCQSARRFFPFRSSSTDGLRYFS
jgi:hypothetical protein